MLTHFCQAVKERRRIRIMYGGERIIEPYVIGYSENQVLLMRVFQVRGYSASGNGQGWKLMRLAKVEYFEILDETFEPRTDYRGKGDKNIFQVICEV